MITSRQKTFLAHAGYKELLTIWRFAPNGSEWFSDPELNEAFNRQFDIVRNELTIPEQIAISQEIGFKGGVARGAFDQKPEFKS